jgi:hypothetical protein
MAEISIDRLILQVPGHSEAEGKRLALAVADALGAAAVNRETGGARALRVDLTAAGDPNQLANRIAAEILRQLRSES